MMQAVGEANRIVAERRFRPQINDAAIAPLHRHRGIAERNRAQRMHLVGMIGRAVVCSGRNGHVGLCAHVRRVYNC